MESLTMPLMPSSLSSSRILGLESSCDETAVAIVRGDKTICAHRVASQNEAHAPFGGVVPEVAARAHVETLSPLIAAVLDEAGCTLSDMDAIAVTAGPGLIGGVMIGLVTAKALSVASGVPLLAINHLAAHALSVRLIADVAFPYWMLLVSGGHCQLLLVEDVGVYHRLATTLDDAAGEAFDKVGKLLGLGFPGGPAVERMAVKGDARRFSLPRPLWGRPEPHFSFAGLKSAVARLIEGGAITSEQDKADVAAAFQDAVADCLVDRVSRQLQRTPARAQTLVAAGGVAANTLICARLKALAAQHGLAFVSPPAWLCTDNAAMVAWAGFERYARGERDGLDVPARARWPLDPSAVGVRGAGVKA